MVRDATFRNGYHGIRPPADVTQDGDGTWLAYCGWCFDQEQEPIIASDLATRREAERKADEHEFRHAGCDPRHITEHLRLHGETEVRELNRLFFPDSPVARSYGRWLFSHMLKRGMIQRRYQGYKHYYSLGDGTER